MWPVLFAFGQFALGLLCLLFGGNLLVRAAIALAARFGAPPLLVGLTIVAWGTSAPELAFNTIAAIQDKPALVFGNVVGANICNIGLVLGVCALLKPLAVHTDIVRRELPLLNLVLITMALMGMLPANRERFIDGSWFSRTDGLLLLAMFVAYTAFTTWSALRRQKADRALEKEVAALEKHEAGRSIWLDLLMFGSGLLLLGLGGTFAAEGASGVARQMGLSEKVIGVTVVSVATTLPEMFTSVIATRKGHVELAIGNVVGSCIFNVACIFGMASVIAPLAVPENGAWSLAVMCILAALLLPMSWMTRGKLGRAGGLTLVAIYVINLAFEAFNAIR